MEYKIPYEFILQCLFPVRLKVRKLFGGYALYHNKQMLLFLRDKESQPEFNGVFVATQPAFFASLQKDLHHSKMEFDLDGTTNSWIFISEDLQDFNEKVKKVCELIKSGDDRIGK